MEKQYLPELELPLDQQVILQLVYDKPLEGTKQSPKGSWQWHLYKVVKDGQVYSWFAPQFCHEEIVRYGLKKGSQFMVKKSAKESQGKLINAYTLTPLATGMSEKETKQINKVGAEAVAPSVWEEKDKRIAKLSCLSSAVELTKGQLLETTIIDRAEEVKEVLTIAQKFYDWIYPEINPNEDIKF